MNSVRIKEFGASLGFTLVGISPLAPTPEGQFFGEWLDRGYAGEMLYLERQKEARLHPETVLPGAASVIVCAVNYNTDFPKTPVNPLRAWISRYAWGRDYHRTLEGKLKRFAQWIRENGAADTRTYVDTGPLTERVFARYAGIGWFGKNTCILNEKAGSWLFLGCVLTTLRLDFDRPAADRCGTCTRCLDACPTDAFAAPYVLDSRKCISYLTIEKRGAIAETERDGIGHHWFGCDICQDVCPWNRRAPVSDEPAFQPREGLFWPEVEALLEKSDEELRGMIQGTPLKRAKVAGLWRNLMVVAGNSGVREIAPRLRRFLEHDDEHVREHARWAVAKLEAGEGRVQNEDP